MFAEMRKSILVDANTEEGTSLGNARQVGDGVLSASADPGHKNDLDTSACVPAGLAGSGPDDPGAGKVR